MTVLKGGKMGSLSGAMGNIVLVSYGNTTYLRSMPTYSKNSWTPKQVQSRKRFAIVTQFCMAHKRNVIVPIWNLLPGNACGYSQFLGANIKAFDSLGNIKDHGLLHFSEGFLEPPSHVATVKEGELLTVSWTNDPNTAAARLKDGLLYMALSGDKVSGPFTTGLTRCMMGGEFTLPDSSARALYLFFAAPDRKAFSSDRYVTF
ncbi:hypothetical protein BA6E_125603 [Bacteroidales bacterium 6E]|nr:hypothetical protein BA6E_125603 [Bacteroidales bacterium 6E]